MSEIVTDGHLGGYMQGGDPGTWCPNLWAWAVKQYRVASVLDVGCGEGHSTAYFQQLGLRVLGIDGCEQAIRDSVIPDRVKRHDFCDGHFAPDSRYDMVWSCEFLEHVEQQYVPHFLHTFSHARLLLITHAFPGQEDGHHHVNCQPSEYWIQRIEQLGFDCRIGETVQARKVTLLDHSKVNHFARSGLVFTRTTRHRQPDPKAARTRAKLKACRIACQFKLSAAYQRQRWSYRLRRTLGSRRAA